MERVPQHCEFHDTWSLPYSCTLVGSPNFVCPPSLSRVAGVRLWAFTSTHPLFPGPSPRFRVPRNRPLIQTSGSWDMQGKHPELKGVQRQHKQGARPPGANCTG